MKKISTLIFVFLFSLENSFCQDIVISKATILYNQDDPLIVPKSDDFSVDIDVEIKIKKNLNPKRNVYLYLSDKEGYGTNNKQVGVTLQLDTANWSYENSASEYKVFSKFFNERIYNKDWAYAYGLPAKLHVVVGSPSSSISNCEWKFVKDVEFEVYKCEDVYPNPATVKTGGFCNFREYTLESSFAKTILFFS